MWYVLIILLITLSCGIKADPQVLMRPKIEIRRIGDTVYVRSLEDAIRIRGFEEDKGFLYKREPKAFCFTVERVGEGKAKYCVDGVLEGKPEVNLRYEKDKVLVKAQGYERYALYAIVNGDLELGSRKDMGESFNLERSYTKLCYALTGVVGSRESYPTSFCLEPLPPPEVEDVKDLEYRTTKDLLILVWSYEGDYQSFLVYSGDKLLGETKGFTFELPLPEKSTTFTVKVKSKEGFMSKGRSILYSP